MFKKKNNNNAPLTENHFIHEEYSAHPWRLWGWLAIVIGCSGIFAWSFLNYSAAIDKQYAVNPFLQVTNRQMSLFLWQNPSHMRVHAKNKNGYLPAFEYVDRVGLNPEYADDYAIAPPELLFLYHTWNRLLGNSFISRPIPAKEFQVFLNENSEWQPRNWQLAPPEYITFTQKLDQDLKADLSLEPLSALPLEVRQAFIGWKNYFFEGNAINNFSATYTQLNILLKVFPHYARPYWRNIYSLNYLKSQNVEPSQKIPPDELSSALRAALFNLSLSDVTAKN